MKVLIPDIIWVLRKSRIKKKYINATVDNELVKKLLENGQSWSDMWLEFGQRKYPYDKNFRAVSEYAKNNYIEEEIKKN